MNIQDYISSGILEQYVLGLLSADEAREVELTADQYPEVREEITHLREALEQYATLHAVTPDPALKARILGDLDGHQSAPPKSEARRNTGPQGPLWIAIVICVIALGAMAFFWNTNRSTSRQIDALQVRYDQLLQDCTNDRAQQAILLSQLAIVRDQGTEAIRLQGTPLSPASQVQVYWNPTLESTLIDVVSLPTPPTDRQYQLWALVNGAPVDMGVIPLDLATDSLTEVPFIAGAGAFAITLEPIGGSANPTLDQMYVIGNVSTG